MKIPLRDALLGFHRTIRHLDGHPVSIRASGITSHGHVISISNEGEDRAALSLCGCPRARPLPQRPGAHVTYPWQGCRCMECRASSASYTSKSWW